MEPTEVAEPSEVAERAEFFRAMVDVADVPYARAVVGARVLTDMKVQTRRHGASRIDLLGSDAAVAGIKHGLRDLVMGGIVQKRELLGLVPDSKVINCEYVTDVLPQVLEDLEERELVTNEGNGHYSLRR